MNVQHILDAKPIAGVTTISPDAALSDAAALLAGQRIGALVVQTDAGELAGILSERDLVRELARRGTACLELRVAHVMTRKIVTCAPGDSAESVLAKMAGGRFRQMPVVSGAAMVGLISIGDVVKARIDDLAMEKSALEGMIMGF